MIRLRIRMLNAKTFGIEIAGMEHGDYTHTLDLITRFPEVKYNQSLGVYRVPATMNNIRYLREMFGDDEIDCDEDVKLQLRYTDLTLSTQTQRAERRWDYVFSGKVPDYDWSLDRGPLVRDGAPCRQCSKPGDFGRAPHDPANGAHRVRDPFKHQIVAADAARGLEFFGHLEEQGTGKTIICLEEAVQEVRLRRRRAEQARKLQEEAALRGSELAVRGEDADGAKVRDPAKFRPVRVLVVCPSSLCLNWLDEIDAVVPRRENWEPGRFPEDAAVRVWSCRMRSDRASVAEDLWVGQKADADLKIWVTNYERIHANVETLRLMEFDYVIADEASDMKNPSAKRTRAMWQLAETCTRRRIGTGTIMANSVFDVWAPFEFLQPGCLGFSTFQHYKDEYGTFARMKDWDKHTGYKNLDRLKVLMAKFSFVVKKKDCLDLPEKSYISVPIEMGERQAAIYESMAEMFIAALDEDAERAHRQRDLEGVYKAQTEGRLVKAAFVIAQLLRLAQITSGFLPGPRDAEGRLLGARRISDGDAKLKAMLDIVENCSGKAIIWCRFHEDMRAVREALDARGIRSVEISGRVKESDRRNAKYVFGEGEAKPHPLNDDGVKVCVGEAGSGGKGLTLLGTKDQPCSTTIFYSYDWSLIKRQQAEDRDHRIGQYLPCTYYVLACRGTLDETIDARLQDKRNMSDELTDVRSIREILLGTKAEDRRLRAAGSKDPMNLRALLKSQGVIIEVPWGSTPKCKDFDHECTITDEAGNQIPNEAGTPTRSCTWCSGDPMTAPMAAVKAWCQGTGSGIAELEIPAELWEAPALSAGGTHEEEDSDSTDAE